MARPYRNRKKNKNLFFIITSILLMLLAVFVGVGAFFSVSIIEVTGLSKYESEEIIEASGIEIGDNLIFLSDSKIAATIRTKYNYVDQVKIVRVFPDTLRIEIQESFPIAYAVIENEYWLIDENCKLLEKSSVTGVEDAIRVDGLEIIEPISGLNIKNTEDRQKADVLSEILKSAKSCGIYEDVISINIENIGNIVLEYDGIYQVKLGNANDCDAKISFFTQMLSKLDGTTKGTIDFTSSDEAHFIPD